ncbi:hypothetical protein J6590_021727 [Homalodisca vitripennis]|nr:hypothetical protein J6590_021727 [Homalodisca vitripennis]
MSTEQANYSAERGSMFCHCEAMRDNMRIQSHRTMAYEQLPSQVGVKVINKLPERIKELATKKRFKARLRDLLVSTLYTLGMWDRPSDTVNGIDFLDDRSSNPITQDRFASSVLLTVAAQYYILTIRLLSAGKKCNKTLAWQSWFIDDAAERRVEWKLAKVRQFATSKMIGGVTTLSPGGAEALAAGNTTNGAIRGAGRLHMPHSAHSRLCVVVHSLHVILTLQAMQFEVPADSCIELAIFLHLRRQHMPHSAHSRLCIVVDSLHVILTLQTVQFEVPAGSCIELAISFTFDVSTCRIPRTVPADSCIELAIFLHLRRQYMPHSAHSRLCVVVHSLHVIPTLQAMQFEVPAGSCIELAIFLHLRRQYMPHSAHSRLCVVVHSLHVIPTLNALTVNSEW